MSYLQKSLLILFLSVCFIANSQNDKIELTKSFLSDMLDFEDLNKYVYNSEGYTIDFYLTEEYVINEVKGDFISVDINTGGGEFWTRLYFKFLMDENNQLFFSGVLNETNSIMTPWYDKSKICPPTRDK